MRLCILTYHSILSQESIDASSLKNPYVLEKSVFEQQMRYLKDNDYATVNFDDIEGQSHSNSRLSKKTIILTFDDGTIDNYSVVLPILKKYCLRATFFIVTGLVGQKNYLSWSQIQEMLNAGMGIQSHTHSHCNLDEASGEKIREELLLSKEILEHTLCSEINVLALPYGRCDGRSLEKIARPAGYRFICNSEWGGNDINDRHFFLKRFTINADCTMGQFTSFVELSSSLILLHNIKKIPRQIAKTILSKENYARIKKALLVKP